MKKQFSVLVQYIVDMLAAGTDLNDTADDIIDFGLKCLHLMTEFCNGLIVLLHLCDKLCKLRLHIRNFAFTEDTFAVAADILVLSIIVPVTLCKIGSTRIQTNRIHEQSCLIFICRQ